MNNKTTKTAKIEEGNLGSPLKIAAESLSTMTGGGGNADMVENNGNVKCALTGEGNFRFWLLLCPVPFEARK